MTLERVPRQPPLDGLDLFRRLDLFDGSRLVDDPSRIADVVKKLQEGLSASLADAKVIGGWRAQAMFASLVVALDGCQLLTQVDLGEVWFDGESVKAPDFHLVLRDDRRILVDVKDVDGSAITANVKFSAREIERLRVFGRRFACDVFLAIYFRQLRTWTLVNIEDLERGPGGRSSN